MDESMEVAKASLTLLFACAALVLGGCAAGSDKYPSLAIRDFEQAGVADTAHDIAAPPSLDAASVTKIRNARDTAQAEHAAFLSALPGVRRKISSTSGLGPNSNAWAEGQIALSTLVSHRNNTALALGNIDAILAEAAGDLINIENARAMQSEVATLVKAQDQALTRLK